jgi:hypothetical protein
MPHSTSSSHRFRGRPLLLPSSIFAVKIILGILLLFILSTYPSHLILKDLKKLTIPSCPVNTNPRKIWWIKATIKLLVITILQLPAYKAYCLDWFRWGETYVSELLPLLSQLIWVLIATVEWYWQEKTEELGRRTCPSATLSTTNPAWSDPGLSGERPATNRLSQGPAGILSYWLHKRVLQICFISPKGDIHEK